MRKTDILETWWKGKFLGKKTWKNTLALIRKVYSGKRLFWYYCLQMSFTYKTMSQISFNLFWSEDKRILPEFLRKLGWFQGHNERFTKYLDLKLKFQKPRPRNFSLAKEKTWKRKTHKHQIMAISYRETNQAIQNKSSKVNLLFNDIWCYLFIACFDLKITIFQQIVVRVFYILNYKNNTMSLNIFDMNHAIR